MLCCASPYCIFLAIDGASALKSRHRYNTVSLVPIQQTPTAQYTLVSISGKKSSEYVELCEFGALVSGSAIDSFSVSFGRIDDATDKRTPVVPPSTGSGVSESSAIAVRVAAFVGTGSDAVMMRVEAG